jgi:hypothetical protein
LKTVKKKQNRKKWRRHRKEAESSAGLGSNE